MSGVYAANVGNCFDPDPSELVLKSIFQQYERVFVESLITSFELDFLIKDQYGGDVDTIHNVRQVGKNPQMTYKSQANQSDYENRAAYNSKEYHQDPRYLAKNKEVKRQRKEGTLVDAYTDERIASNGKSDLDHVISAKEIHDDRGRVLAGIAGTDLANSEENLHATNPHTNRTKKADSMDEFLEKYGDEYTADQRANMHLRDTVTRKSYEAKLAQEYYTSPKFAKDLTQAAGNVGVRMGARQALGFVFAEMWFAVKEEFQKVGDNFDFGAFLTALGHGIQNGFERAKRKYDELFSRFLSGTVAGALASLTTTLCNIFFSTAKNVVKVIRQSWASLVEAGKVLFINPDHYSFGERMRAVVKILATGASVVVGVIVSDAVGKTPVAQIPVLGEIVQTFCGTFVTGIMSCTLLYFFDRSELINKLVKMLDGLHTIETELNYYREQAAYFEKYAAELMKIDLEQFQKEVALYNGIAAHIENAKTEKDLNLVLRKALKDIGAILPWDECRSFDSFMSDKNARLVFE